MPILIKQIEFSIAEQFNGGINLTNKLNCKVGYGGSFIKLPGYLCIIQNFDQVIKTIKYREIFYYGLKNKVYSEIKISY